MNFIKLGGISFMKNKQLLALFYGLAFIFSIIFVSSMVIAFLLRFTTFNEPVLSWTTLIIGLIALFIGGLVAGLKNKDKGWIVGGMVGLGFTLIIFCIQYLGYKQAFSLEQSFHHLGYVVAALLGGIFGVNIVSHEQSK